MDSQEIEDYDGSFELPDGTQLRISDVPGYNELTDKQRYFLECYVENFPSIAISLVRSGTKKSELQAWNYSEDGFNDVFTTIKDLHVEGLLIKEYTDSIGNSKIRGRVLMSLNAPGYEKKTGVTNNHLHLSADTDLFTAITAAKDKSKLAP